MSVQRPAPGAWQARVSNLSAEGIEHYQFTYFANKGAPLAEGENLFLTPATPGEAGTDHYRITWRVPPAATDEATIGLYATRLGDDRLGNTEEAVPIVLNLPLKQGFFDWNLTSFPFGDYAVSGQVDDGINDTPAANSENLCDPPSTRCLPSAPSTAGASPSPRSSLPPARSNPTTQPSPIRRPAWS